MEIARYKYNINKEEIHKDFGTVGTIIDVPPELY